MASKDFTSASGDGNVRPTTAESPVMVVTTELKAGTLSLPEVLMQNVAVIAPAIASLFYTPVVVGLAGLFILYAPTVGGIVALYMGNILQQELRSNLGINWPWFMAAFMIVVITGVALLQYRGIKISTKALLVLGLIEMGLVVLLGIWAIANPGPGGVNFLSYNPALIASQGGIAGFSLAVIFSLLAFVGWDGAAPLAEETANPTKNVSRAVIGSIILLGVFLVLVTWAIIIGWGT